MSFPTFSRWWTTSSHRLNAAAILAADRARTKVLIGGQVQRTLFDDVHDLYRDGVRTFISREVAPHFEKWEREGIVDKALYPKAGSVGLMGLKVPEEYGGGGIADFRVEVIVQ